MALEEYQRKRDFRRTPEPAGAPPRRRKRPAPGLSFVIQKHAARRLHYGFRLELGGVLKSWAVPKGPSLDPAEKRLAVHVEDHPLEYGGFEGVIPAGQYGSGTVLLWDRGSWTPLDADPVAAYRQGSLKFLLHGEKLHGKWALVRMGGRAAARTLHESGRENWLLLKERDELAVPGSGPALVEDNPLSVATGRSMTAIAAARDRIWQVGQGEIAAAPPARKPAKARRRPVTLPAGGRAAELPERLAPQLAMPAERPPDGDEWLHEIKYDGYRLLARIERGAVRLTTRGGQDWTARFPGIGAALADLPVRSALIDGELVALAADGRTSFADLQDRIAARDTGGLVFLAFDLPYCDGSDLTAAALEDRKAVLTRIVSHDGAAIVRYSDHQIGRGADFLRHAAGYGLEGIVSKRRDRPYRSGRSGDWRKIKCVSCDEFVIVGFTDPAGQRVGFGALLLGYYDRGGRLRYAGRVGTGFRDALLAEMRQRFGALVRRRAPLVVPAGTPVAGVHWLEPQLVAEIRYAGWTADAILRHTTFEGLREDKSAAEVIYDPPPARADPASAQGRKPGAAAARPAAAADPAPVRPGGTTDFAGVRLSNAGRLLYPDPGITKLALAQYYGAVVGWALPHLAGRPLSLLRCPEGCGKECFFQKHIAAGRPAAVRQVEIADPAGGAPDSALVIDDLAGLVALVQLGVLEIHPWGATLGKVETPDRITFDLDPDAGLEWRRVGEAAIDMREALIGIGLQSFAKTTGGKGLHVVVPLTPRLRWDAAKQFARWVAEKFATAYPDRFTANMAKRARTGRIFIDYLRNGRGATAIGAYSPRARPGAPVATPVSWDEVEAGIAPDAFTVLNLPDRLSRLAADPWAEIGKVRQSLSAAIRREVGI